MNEDRITGQRAGSMTREQRIEAAARAIADLEFDDMTNEEIVGVVLTAAYPEIMSDPPTGWVAPIRLTKELAQVLDDLSWGEFMEAARDAYTKEQT